MSREPGDWWEWDAPMSAVLAWTIIRIAGVVAVVALVAATVI